MNPVLYIIWTFLKINPSPWIVYAWDQITTEILHIYSQILNVHFSSGIHLNGYSWSKKKKASGLWHNLCWPSHMLGSPWVVYGVWVRNHSRCGVSTGLHGVCVCQEEAELTCYHFLQSDSAWGWYAVEKCQAGCEGIRSVQISLKVSTGRLTES